MSCLTMSSPFLLTIHISITFPLPSYIRCSLVRFFSTTLICQWSLAHLSCVTQALHFSRPWFISSSISCRSSSVSSHFSASVSVYLWRFPFALLSRSRIPSQYWMVCQKESDQLQLPLQYNVKMNESVLNSFHHYLQIVIQPFGDFFSHAFKNKTSWVSIKFEMWMKCESWIAASSLL